MAGSLIGVDIDDLRRPPKDALQWASAKGFRAVEFGAVTGELSYRNLSSSGRRHVRRLLANLGLSASSLVADVPGGGAAGAEASMEHAIRVLEMAREIAVPVVTASPGVLIDPATKAPIDSAMEALRGIAEAADAMGVTFALRPTRDRGEDVERVIRGLACPRLKLCLDPAALVMGGIDPAGVLAAAGESISLVHARDGTAGGPERSGHETRFGEGEVDLVGLWALLSAHDYRGAFIARRSQSSTAADDLDDARAALERLAP